MTLQKVRARIVATSAAPRFQLGLILVVAFALRGRRPERAFLRGPEKVVGTVGDDRCRPTAPGGNGLGLSLCRSLAWESGGDLKVESELGRGTEVVLTFPVERSRG